MKRKKIEGWSVVTKQVKVDFEVQEDGGGGAWWCRFYRENFAFAEQELAECRRIWPKEKHRIVRVTTTEVREVLPKPKRKKRKGTRK